MAEELAIHGGEKSVNKEGQHFSWPEVDKDTESAVIKQLNESISIYNRSGAIEELEEKLKEMHSCKHALLFNSGTMALYAMFSASGIKEGDEVICPAYTFYATVTPLFSLGAIPVLVDCDENGNIDPDKIEEKISSKTKAIVLTHMWSIPCQMDKIKQITKKYDLILLEDGSHAHFSEYNGQKVGTFGDASTFSLQGQKTLTGGEGGFIITNNDEIFYKALLLGHYNKRCKAEIPKDHELSKYSVTGMGLKLRIHPLACAITLDQIKKIDKIIEGREYFANKIKEGLKDLDCLEVVSPDYDVKQTWYALIIKYLPEKLGVSREEFYGALKAEGCSELDIPGSTSPLNLLPLFQDPSKVFPKYKLDYKEGDFPNAEKFYKSILKLPVWHKKEDEKLVEDYINAFKKVVNYYKNKNG